MKSVKQKHLEAVHRALDDRDNQGSKWKDNAQKAVWFTIDKLIKSGDLSEAELTEIAERFSLSISSLRGHVATRVNSYRGVTSSPVEVPFDPVSAKEIDSLMHGFDPSHDIN